MRKTLLVITVITLATHVFGQIDANDIQEVKTWKPDLGNRGRTVFDLDSNVWTIDIDRVYADGEREPFAQPEVKMSSLVKYLNENVSIPDTWGQVLIQLKLAVKHVAWQMVKPKSHGEAGND